MPKSYVDADQLREASSNRRAYVNSYDDPKRIDGVTTRNLNCMVTYRHWFKRVMKLRGFNYTPAFFVFAKPLNVVFRDEKKHYISSIEKLCGVIYPGLSPELRIYVFEDLLMLAYVKTVGDVDSLDFHFEDDSYLVDELIKPMCDRRRYKAQSESMEGIVTELFRFFGVRYNITAEQIIASLLSTSSINDIHLIRRLLRRASMCGMPLSGLLMNAAKNLLEKKLARF